MPPSWRRSTRPRWRRRCIIRALGRNLRPSVSFRLRLSGPYPDWVDWSREEPMRKRLLIPVLIFAAPLLAGAPLAPKVAATRGVDTAPAVPLPAKGMHRYMVTRTFPAGALAG